MNIVVNDQKITIYLCDEHAENTTVKTAKDKYIERQNKINDLMEQAKKLGLDLTTQHTEAAKPEKRTERKVSNADVPQTETEGERWISTSKFEDVEERGSSSVGGQGAQSYTNYKPSQLTDTLDDNLRDGKVKIGIIEGRDGSPVPIPLERIDGTGTTSIRIVKTETDQTLQKRFKAMANMGLTDDQPDFRRGYTESTRDCPICRGDCFVNGKTCPKCNGSGLISLI
jgi:hypothetical protein